MIREGSRVVYAGDDTMIGVGTEGKVLAHAGSDSVHVQWTAGLRQSEVDIVPNDDVIESSARPVRQASQPDDFGDSLDTPIGAHMAVRETYDEYGEEGVLNALSESGHLAMLTEYAGEALGHVASRLRDDPTFSSVLAQLDETEAESLLARVAVDLFREEKD